MASACSANCKVSAMSANTCGQEDTGLRPCPLIRLRHSSNYAGQRAHHHITCCLDSTGCSNMKPLDLIRPRTHSSVATHTSPQDPTIRPNRTNSALSHHRRTPICLSGQTSPLHPGQTSPSAFPHGHRQPASEAHSPLSRASPIWDPLIFKDESLPPRPLVDDP